MIDLPRVVRPLTVCLLFLLPQLSIGQASSSVDLVLGLDYTYRSLRVGDVPDILKDFTVVRNREEAPQLQWRAGVNYNRRLGSRFHLRTGIRLANVGYRGQKFTDLRWGSEFSGNGQYVPDPSLPHESRSSYSYWFIEVPLVGRYAFSGRRFSPFVELGLAPSVYLTTRTRTVTDLDKFTEYQRDPSSEFNKVHIVGLITFGTNYTLTDRLQLYAQPTARYHLTSLYDAPIQEQLFSVGLELGVRRLFR
ncbi:outer membrane beta-barrel protein [Neolewinella maritima]|nr:outer membrane beta-barrel protein [Neolewinella maritima]